MSHVDGNKGYFGSYLKSWNVEVLSYEDFRLDFRKKIF